MTTAALNPRETYTLFIRETRPRETLNYVQQYNGSEMPEVFAAAELEALLNGQVIVRHTRVIGGKIASQYVLGSALADRAFA
jgi:hypothetical protein